MNILITGTTGFVGTHLLEKLENYNKFKLAAVVRDKSIINIKNNVQLIHIKDNLNFEKEIINFNPEIVIHLASHLTGLDDSNSFKKLIKSNIEFPGKLLECLRKTSLKYFINTGTFAEYSNNNDILDPAYLYSATKISFRPILKYFSKIIGFKTISIIPYTIYGGKSKNKKVIDYLLESLNTKEMIDMTPGEQKLDFIHIDDITSFYIYLINNLDKINELYIEFKLGTGVGTSIKELATKIENITGKKTNINWGGKPYRKTDIMKAIANTKNLDLINWSSKITIEEGLKKIIEEQK